MRRGIPYISQAYNYRLPRLLEYSLLSISGCSFLQSVDELLEFMETWGLRDFIYPLARLEIHVDLNIYMCRGVLVQLSPGLSGPRYTLTSHPSFVIGSLC